VKGGKKEGEQRHRELKHLIGEYGKIKDCKIEVDLKKKKGFVVEVAYFLHKNGPPAKG
jgi:hypothetical protein